MGFESFGLDPRAMRALKAMGIETPTPIQDQAIPPALEGVDIVAIAQTGTGKTLAFALPSLTRLAQGKIEPSAMLVLVPTRELCVQVHKVIDNLGKAMGIKCSTVYGGVGFERQTTALRGGSSVIVATPGRLLDHMGRGNVNFRHLAILVLDEADRMLDMGFLPDIKRILRKLPDHRQTLLFSATFPDEMDSLAGQLQKDPIRISVGAVEKPVDTVRQTLYPVHSEHKTKLLMEVLSEAEVLSTLIFLRTKSRTERLAHALKKKGYSIAQIHGDRSQKQRELALDGFRNGKYTILVATDVAARGLDIDGVSHVVNYDIPESPDDYIHRIGRTARASSKGDAITFVSPGEFQALGAIERKLGHNIPREEWDHAPQVLSVFKPESARRNRGIKYRATRRLHRRR